MPRLARKKEAIVHMTITVPARVRARLEELRELTEAESMSDVIRRALAVYDFLVIQKLGGGHVVLRRADGSEVELALVETPPAVGTASPGLPTIEKTWKDDD